MNHGYTAFHKYVPKYGIAVYVVVEKNVYITERFFDNHYKRGEKIAKENQ